MISKILSRTAISFFTIAKRSFTLPIVSGFAKQVTSSPKIDTSSLKNIVEDEIKEEEGNIPDLTESLTSFKEGGWTVNHLNTQV